MDDQASASPEMVGTPGWMGRDGFSWDQVRLLDVVEREYGRVMRWWLVAIREAVVFGVVFWFVAFGFGLLGSTEVDRVSVAGTEVHIGVVVLGVTVLLRLAITLAGRVRHTALVVSRRSGSLSR